MQRRIADDAHIGGQELARRGFRQRRRRGGDVPFRARGQRAAPFGQAAFAIMDFLATADQADNDRPVGVAGHDIEENGGLGVRQADRAITAFADGVGPGPGALCLVNNYNAFRGDMRWMHNIVVAECGQGLDQRSCVPPRRTECPSVAISLGSRQRAAQHMDERGIAGQERGTDNFAPFGAEHDIQAAQCLARAGDAGDEDDGAPFYLPGGADNTEDGFGRAGQVGGIGARGLDVGDRIASVQQTGRIDDIRHGPVGRRFPAIDFERLFRRRDAANDRADRGGERCLVRGQHRRDRVPQQRPALARWCARY